MRRGGEASTKVSPGKLRLPHYNHIDSAVPLHLLPNLRQREETVAPRIQMQSGVVSARRLLCCWMLLQHHIESVVGTRQCNSGRANSSNGADTSACP